MSAAEPAGAPPPEVARVVSFSGGLGSWYAARHASAGAIVHEPDACFLCGANLSEFRALPFGERIFKIAGFHVVDDAGRAHLGSLCWPCHYPDASLRAIVERLRADDARRAQPPLFD